LLKSPINVVVPAIVQCSKFVLNSDNCVDLVFVDPYVNDGILVVAVEYLRHYQHLKGNIYIGLLNFGMQKPKRVISP